MVDVMARTVTLRGRNIQLTPTEQVIFYTLVKHAGKLVSRKHLFRCVWGSQSETKLHDLHVYIANLRQKFRDASDQVLIQTEDAGYRVLVPTSNSIHEESATPTLEAA